MTQSNHYLPKYVYFGYSFKVQLRLHKYIEWPELSIKFGRLRCNRSLLLVRVTNIVITNQIIELCNSSTGSSTTALPIPGTMASMLLSCTGLESKVTGISCHTNIDAINICVVYKLWLSLSTEESSVCLLSYEIKEKPIGYRLFFYFIGQLQDE